MQVEALAPFGAEISGLSLAGPFDTEGLIAVLAEHGVAVLRRQPIDDDTFVAALSRLGTMTFTEGETPVERQPMLNVVSSGGRTTPPRSVFHSDTTYVSEPPAFTALRAVTIPAEGGQTVFSDQYRAAGSLPPRMRERLIGATVLHGVTGLTPEQVAGSQSHARHPLLRRHPISGREALFLSTPERLSAIELADGPMDEVESRELIEWLYEHSLKESGLYHHAWEWGDVVVWDNRCTLHKADHSGVVGDRVMHRGMVKGERPIPA